MTQQDLADASGIGIGSIKSIETGRTQLAEEYAEKLGDVLGVDFDVFYKRETKVISIANNKGGSGKSSLTSSLSYTFTKLGYKVLVIDADAQMNLTRSFGLDKNPEKNIYDAIMNNESMEKYIISSGYQNLDIVVSDYNMASIEMALFTMIQRESRIKTILKPVVDSGHYDYIFFDTNPTLGILNFNVFNACDEVLVPVELSTFGVDGVEIILNYIDEVKNTVNPDLHITGIVLNKVDERKNITKDIRQIIKSLFGDLVLKSQIGTDTLVEQSQFAGVPLPMFAPNARATKQYEDLAKEVIRIVESKK
jgi:chromosome partitioning protein